MHAKVNRPAHHRATAGRIASTAPSRGSVSVVMTAFNHEKYIAEAIESILGQTYGDFDLIIVNDGSTDGTEEVIRGFRDRRITCISQANQGESAAVNHGCAVATGAYIALMDGDDVSHPMRIERQRHLLLSQEARAVTSWIALIDDDGAPLDEYLGLVGVINTPPSCSRAESLRRLWRGNYSASSVRCRALALSRSWRVLPYVCAGTGLSSLDRDPQAHAYPHDSGAADTVSHS